MPEVQRSSLTRVIASSLIDTTIEWYDFFLYGSAAALVFNKLFFPSFDPLVGTLLAFATYAVGCVARPLGGIVSGHYGDRIGRKKLLMWSLVMMGLATVLIGLLPGYGSIGIWAPVGLIVLRVLQGFAVGGEWGGAVLLAAGARSAGPASLHRNPRADGTGADECRLRPLGLARALPALGDPRHRRLVHPQPGDGESYVRGGDRSGETTQHTGHRRVP